MTDIVSDPEPDVRTRKPDKRGNFFAVDRRAWPAVCRLGMNAAVAYLVLARGSGRDNRTNSWSVNSIEQYTGISRPRAQRAVQALEDASLITCTKRGTKPRYFITPGYKIDEVDDTLLEGSDWIWLPNEIVNGVKGVPCPIERLRQTHHVAALRLFVELYHAQNLFVECGLDWRPDGGIWQSYERMEVGRGGRFIVWAFEPGSTFVQPDLPFVQPLIDRSLKDEMRPFWDAWGMLIGMGLVEMVPHLVDSASAEGEVIHPLPEDCGEPEERAITAAAYRAAVALADEGRMQYAEGQGSTLFAPIDRHRPDAQVVGIARLRYRPKTAATQTWFSRTASCEHVARDYDAVAEGRDPGPA